MINNKYVHFSPLWLLGLTQGFRHTVEMSFSIRERSYFVAAPLQRRYLRDRVSLDSHGMKGRDTQREPPGGGGRGFGLEERIDFPVGESIQCRTKSAPRVEVLVGWGGGCGLMGKASR